MRIDTASKSSAAANTNVGDLMSRLDTGDVIKAKVIEITSDEAILRLFDGTSMKAKLAEKLDVSAGQTITLSVASKSEGTLILETVKDLNSRLQLKPDLLKNILESLNLKPDNRNAEVATELIKAGQTVTRDSVGSALQLMDAVPEMTADKAVFLSSKNISASQLDPVLANKLLNGDLKLGTLLGDLQDAIEQPHSDNNSNGVSDSKNAGSMAKDLPGISGNAAGTKNQAFDLLSATAKSNQSSDLPSGTARSGQASGSSSVITESHRTPSFVISGRQTPGAGIDTSSMQTAVSDGKAVANQPADSSAQSAGTENVRTGSMEPDSDLSAARNLSGRASDYVQADKNSSGHNPGGDNTAVKADIIIEGSRQNEASKAAVKGWNAETGDLSADEAVNRNTEAKSGSEAVSRMKESIKDVFVSTDSDKLASELDANKLYKELDSRLDTLKAAVHASEFQGTKADIVSNAANMISDTIKVIDQLNSGGLMYYQIPVRVSDTNTTAELYIMKKQRNKKKIDPGNTVMFISLDTENLGRVETLIDVKGKNLSIQLRTEKQEISDYIKEYTKDLYNGLSELGYKLSGIRFKIIDEPATPIKQESLLKEMEQGYMGRVDFRI